MPGRRFSGWRGVALRLLAVGLVLAVLAVGVAWTGLYNVAARTGHWEITRLFLEFALRQSVATQSMGVEVPRLDDEDLLRLGAGHFAGGCAPCHGAPGVPRSPIVRQMLPEPPDLAQAAGEWRDRELFWIVRNGLKYTGMPAWVAPQRDDEVWSLVAFLKRLPATDAAAYAILVRDARDSGREVADLASPGAAMASCARCHGDASLAPSSRLVPRLDVLPARYMSAALAQYADGSRPSGIMQPIAAALDSLDLARLATNYAELTSRQAEAERPSTADPARIDAGRRIAENGVREAGIPPCLACHGPGGSDLFPRLAGQHARYIIGQLALWQRGLRDTSVTGAIMAPIARRLSGEQIAAVGAYFESLPRGAHHPASADLARNGSPSQ